MVHPAEPSPMSCHPKLFCIVCHTYSQVGADLNCIFLCRLPPKMPINFPSAMKFQPPTKFRFVFGAFPLFGRDASINLYIAAQLR